MVRAALIACGLLAACGDDHAGGPVPDDPTATGGTRLVAERWVTADGTGAFARWYDTELGVACTFVGTLGGARCLPVGAVVAYGAFLDAACTQRAIEASSACTEVVYARDGAEVVRATGAPQTMVYVRGSDLPCSPFSSPDRVYFARGEAVPLERFAAAETALVGATLVTTEYRGADGSRQRVVLDDGRGQATSAVAGLECQVRLTGPRTAECTFASSGGAATTHYSDDQCTLPVIEPQGFPSPLTLRYGARACAPTPLLQLGEQRTVTGVFYRDGSGGCVPLQIIGTTVFDIAPVAGNIAMTLEVDETPTTRLRHTTWVTATGERWPGPLYDVTLEAPCVPRADAEGHARCVPALNDTFVPQLAVSASQSCTPRTIAAAACWGQSVRAERRARSACGYPLYGLRQATGALVSGPLVTGDFVDECAPVDATGLELREGDYAATDGAAYAELTLQRDP